MRPFFTKNVAFTCQINVCSSGAAPGHLQSNADVPLSKVPNPQMPHRPLDDLATHPAEDSAKVKKIRSLLISLDDIELQLKPVWWIYELAPIVSKHRLTRVTGRATDRPDINARPEAKEAK